MGRPSRRRDRPPPHVRIAAADRLPPPGELLRGGPLPTPLQERRFMWGFPSLSDLETEDGGEPCPAPSHASSFAAPPSDLPRAERTGGGTRVRQSVLYSDRRRHLGRRRPSQHVEHPTEVTRTELQVRSLPIFEAPSASASAEFHPIHPGAEGSVSGTCIRQSVLYSSRQRRPQRRQVPLLTEDHPSEVSRSLLRGAVTDLSAIEALSLMNELPLLSPDETSEDSDADYGIKTRQFVTISALSESDSNDDNDHAQHEPIELGIGSFGPQTLRYSEPRPRVKFGEGIPRRGQLTFEEINARTRAKLDRLRLMGPSVSDSDDSSFSPKSTEDSDDDFKQGTELAGKSGTESPQPLQSSSAAAQHSTPKEPRCEASNAQLAENAENWMTEELKIVFEKYIERRDDLKGLDWCFNELCHQCFNVEHYHKIFHHYNFTVRMKKPDSIDWVVALYFAEVKQIFGRKYSFCCRLEPYENGHCYACKSQNVEDLQHPATGGYDNGSPHVGFGLWYE